MERIFLDLVNLSLTAGWLISAVVLLRLIFKKAPKWITCAMWLMVGLRLLLPFSLESALSLIPSSQPLNPGIILESNKLNINTGIPAVDTPVNDHLADTYYEGLTVPADYSLNITTVLTAVWISGIIVLFAYSIISFLRLHFRLRTATVLRDNIRETEFISSPFVLGLFKPVIYLPYNMSESDCANVLAHENAHIKRLDHILKPLMFLIFSVYWFNPLVWLAYALFCRDIELACDERVIKSLNKDERKAYSSALLACSAERRRIAPCPLAFGETDVKMRIKTVLSYKKPAFWVAAVAVVCVAVCGVCFMTSPKTDEPIIDLSDIEQMRVETGNLRFIYADESTAIFEGDNCGVCVFDLKCGKITERIPLEEYMTDKFSKPDSAVSIDGKTIFLGGFVKGIVPKEDYTELSKLYDIQSKKLTLFGDRLKAIANLEPDKWVGAMKTASEEYEVKYASPEDYPQCFNNKDYFISHSILVNDSVIHLRTTLNQSMANLQLVVYNLKSSKENVYDVWNFSNQPNNPQKHSPDLSDIEQMNIGAEMPRFKYGDKTTAIFEGGCGVVVYDLEQSKLVDRIPYDEIANLADFKMPVTAVTEDGKTLYIGEAQPDANAPFGKYIYKYDFKTMSFSKIEPIDWDDVKAFASSELAAGYNKEYDKYLDLSYVISYEKVDLDDSFMYLRAKSDWSMKSLQLVVYNFQSGLSKIYDVWENSEATVTMLTDTSTIKDFEYEIVSGGAKITDCKNYGENVIIPEEINGLPVTEIKDDAFYQHTKMCSVTLPRNLKK